jgi:hypothetical protein
VCDSLRADGWANDWPDWLNIVGLPDVRLFPADAPLSSVRYTGQRTVADMLAWLQLHMYVCVGVLVCFPSKRCESGLTRCHGTLRMNYDCSSINGKAVMSDIGRVVMT